MLALCPDSESGTEGGTVGYGVSHWWGLQVAELQVWPSGSRGLAQQQDGE